MDGVELLQTRVGGDDGRTVIAPMRLLREEPHGVTLLQPLETSYVRVTYRGREMAVRDLPVQAKARIQQSFMEYSLDEMGRTRGHYRFAGSAFSNNCVDMPLHLLDRSFRDHGISFSGGSFAQRFVGCS